MARGKSDKDKDDKDAGDWLAVEDTRKSAEKKEAEGATDTSFKETAADKQIEEQTGTPGQASKQFQALSDAEKNLYGKPLTEGGRPHPVAKPGERQR
jgi:hypothetical protein